MEFKKLEIKEEGSWLKRKLKTPQIRKTLIYIVIGAAAGVVYLFAIGAKNMDIVTSGDIIKSMLMGGFFGFFITNSPCARGRC